MADRWALSGLWNQTTTWSTSPGGAGGASVPTAGDDVHFDGSSGNVSVASADGDGYVHCRNLFIDFDFIRSINTSFYFLKVHGTTVSLQNESSNTNQLSLHLAPSDVMTVSMEGPVGYFLVSGANHDIALFSPLIPIGGFLTTDPSFYAPMGPNGRLLLFGNDVITFGALPLATGLTAGWTDDLEMQLSSVAKTNDGVNNDQIYSGLVGQQATVSVGTVEITELPVISLEGQSVTTAMGSVTVSLPEAVEIIGIGLTASMEGVTVGIDITTDLTGRSLTTAQGSISVTGTANVVADGASARAEGGSATLVHINAVPVTGQRLVTALGSVQATWNTSATLEGEGMTASNGDVASAVNITITPEGFEVLAENGDVMAELSVSPAIEGIAATATEGDVIAQWIAVIMLEGMSVTATEGNATLVHSELVNLTSPALLTAGTADSFVQNGWAEIANVSNEWVRMNA